MHLRRFSLVTAPRTGEAAGTTGTRLFFVRTASRFFAVRVGVDADKVHHEGLLVPAERDEQCRHFPASNEGRIVLFIEEVRDRHLEDACKPLKLVKAWRTRSGLKARHRHIFHVSTLGKLRLGHSSRFTELANPFADALCRVS